MLRKYCVLGNGSWSSALVKLLVENKKEVLWWMRNEDAVTHLNEHGRNLHYLSSVQYDTKYCRATNHIADAIKEGDVILVGIPSAFIKDVLKNLDKNIFKNKLILSAIKGLLPDEHFLLNDLLHRDFHVTENEYLCVSGPCHAEEVASEKLSYLTFGALEEALGLSISKDFETAYLNTIYTKDVQGIQYAAVLKNIYALGAGIAHGLEYGDNFLSVFITNCFAEMQNAMSLFASEQQHHYNTSAYLGDLLVTCYSLYSRNRTFGNYIGRGYSVNAAQLELNMVAEGYYASKGIYNLCQKKNMQLPIAEAVYKILWEAEDVKLAYKKIEKIIF